MPDTLSKMSDRDLLITMVTEIKYIKEQVKELKDVVSSKVGVEEFKKLEIEVDAIKKAQESISLKLAWYAGAIAVAVAVLEFVAKKYL